METSLETLAPAERRSACMELGTLPIPAQEMGGRAGLARTRFEDDTEQWLTRRGPWAAV